MFGFKFRDILWMAAATVLVIAILFPELLYDTVDQAVLPVVDKAAVDYLEWRGRSMSKEEMSVGKDSE